MKNVTYINHHFIDQRYSINRFNGYKNYGPPTGWIDRSSDPYEPVNLFNAGYQHIPSFTYTAVLPFGFIFELKSQVIEIPLDVRINHKY